MPQQGRGGGGGGGSGGAATTAPGSPAPTAGAQAQQTQQQQQQQGVFKPLGVLAMPGLYLVYKYNQFKRQQQENNRRKLAERELNNLNNKIVSTGTLHSHISVMELPPHQYASCASSFPKEISINAFSAAAFFPQGCFSERFAFFGASSEVRIQKQQRQSTTLNVTSQRTEISKCERPRALCLCLCVCNNHKTPFHHVCTIFLITTIIPVQMYWPVFADVANID